MEIIEGKGRAGAPQKHSRVSRLGCSEAYGAKHFIIL